MKRDSTTPSPTGSPPVAYPNKENVIITHPQNFERTAEAF